jgi:hypothetical protein
MGIIAPGLFLEIPLLEPVRQLRIGLKNKRDAFWTQAAAVFWGGRCGGALSKNPALRRAA